MTLIDSHCHLDDPRFDTDRIAVLHRANIAGVTKQLVPAVTAATWPRLRDVCNSAMGLYPAYGLHPMFLAQHMPEHLTQLTQWIEREKPIAVGECGLDFYLPQLDRHQQKMYFDSQLQLAKEFDLPLIIHARKAVDAVVQSIRYVKNLRGIVHSFSGSLQQAQQLIDLGFVLGFGGPITYPRATRLRRLIQQLPLSAIVIETDAPDQPLFNYRGERNEPAYLPEVAQAIAQLRNINSNVVIEQNTLTLNRLFRF
jgi:TatD DNase family protein